ncbi:MAG: hypothetical protein IKO86_00950 [Prevotella sp.]|nr:hypothetical protein [Prevotella sp.]
MVWFAKPVPFGRTILSYIPAVAAPWKGAHPEAENSLSLTLRQKAQPSSEAS